MKQILQVLTDIQRHLRTVYHAPLSGHNRATVEMPPGNVAWIQYEYAGSNDHAATNPKRDWKRRIVKKGRK